MFEKKERSFWVKVSLFYFFSIALVGLSIRYGFMSGFFPLEYKNLLHTHSHIGFLGWIYPMLFLLITNNFFTKEQIAKSKYQLQFYITQILILLMLFSFLYQGYGLFSIIFSSLFQLMTYWFCFTSLKNFSKSEKTLASKFTIIALISLFISSFGTWALPIIKVNKLDYFYELAIYFYLHFQYNGWLSFALLGLFFKNLENKEVKYDLANANKFLYLYGTALVPAYFLSVLAKEVSNIVFYIATIAGSLQVLGLIFFIRLFIQNFAQLIKNESKISNSFLTISVSAFALKVVLQSLSSISYFRELAFFNRLIILSYIHLTLIGFISFFLLSLLIRNNYLKLNNYLTFGLVLLLIGFIISEFILVLGGLSFNIPNFIIAILIFSFFMLLGIFSINLSQYKK